MSAEARSRMAESDDPIVFVEPPCSPEGVARGSVLLVHGSAPFNADGFIPLKGTTTPYGRHPFFRDLALVLRNQGFHVVRYSKPGVFQDGVNSVVYAMTDLACLSDQLVRVFRHLPHAHPRLVLAWSEGTLHLRALPLGELDGVVLLGGIATNIADVIASQGGPIRPELESQLSKMGRTEMIGLDRPAGRLVDELALEDNWRSLVRYAGLQFLVLHGSEDREVPSSQADVFAAHLPAERTTVLIGEGLDHRFMPPGGYDLVPLGLAICEWVEHRFPA